MQGWQEYLNYLGMFAIAVSLHILLGTYNSVIMGTKSFSWGTFFKGVAKGAIISVCLMGLAYITEQVNFLPDEISPKVLLQSGIVYYSLKVAEGVKYLIFPTKEVQEEADRLTPKKQKTKQSSSGSTVAQKEGTADETTED